MGINSLSAYGGKTFKHKKLKILNYNVFFAYLFINLFATKTANAHFFDDLENTPPTVIADFSNIITLESPWWRHGYMAAVTGILGATYAEAHKYDFLKEMMPDACVDDNGKLHYVCEHFNSVGLGIWAMTCSATIASTIKHNGYFHEKRYFGEFYWRYWWYRSTWPNIPTLSSDYTVMWVPSPNSWHARPGFQTHFYKGELTPDAEGNVAHTRAAIPKLADYYSYANAGTYMREKEGCWLNSEPAGPTTSYSYTGTDDPNYYMELDYVMPALLSRREHTNYDWGLSAFDLMQKSTICVKDDYYGIFYPKIWEFHHIGWNNPHTNGGFYLIDSRNNNIEPIFTPPTYYNIGGMSAYPTVIGNYIKSFTVNYDNNGEIGACFGKFDNDLNGLPEDSAKLFYSTKTHYCIFENFYYPAHWHSAYCNFSKPYYSTNNDANFVYLIKESATSKLGFVCINSDETTGALSVSNKIFTTGNFMTGGLLKLANIKGKEIPIILVGEYVDSLTKILPLYVDKTNSVIKNFDGANPYITGTKAGNDTGDIKMEIYKDYLFIVHTYIDAETNSFKSALLYGKLDVSLDPEGEISNVRLLSQYTKELPETAYKFISFDIKNDHLWITYLNCNTTGTTFDPSNMTYKAYHVNLEGKI